MTDKQDKRANDAARTPAEGKAPERPDRSTAKGRGKRPKPSDRLGYIEDFLPSD